MRVSTVMDNEMATRMVVRWWWWCYVLVVVTGTLVEGQFRNDRDHEALRDDYWRSNYRNRGYTTPPSTRTRYNSGDTYYGTDNRYQDTRYDDPSQLRGSDGRYLDQEFRYSENPRLSGNYLGRGRYDARGRERPGAHAGDDPWDQRYGILEIWRPDLQGERRPSEEPGKLKGNRTGGCVLVVVIRVGARWEGRRERWIRYV